MRLFFLLSSLCLFIACQESTSEEAASGSADSTFSATDTANKAPVVGGLSVEKAKLEQEIREVPLPKSSLPILQHYIQQEDMLRTERSKLMLALSEEALDERYFYVDKNFEIQETRQPGKLQALALSPYHPYVHQYIIGQIYVREDYMRDLTVSIQGQAGNEVFALRFKPGEKNNKAPQGWNDWKGSFDFELACPETTSDCNAALLKKTERALNSLLRRTM